MEKIIDNKNGTYSFQRDGKILHTGKWGDKYVAPKVDKGEVIKNNKPNTPTKQADLKTKLGIPSFKPTITQPTQTSTLGPVATPAPKFNLFDFSSLQTPKTPSIPFKSTGPVAQKPAIQSPMLPTTTPMDTFKQGLPKVQPQAPKPTEITEEGLDKIIVGLIREGYKEDDIYNLLQSDDFNIKVISKETPKEAPGLLGRLGERVSNVGQAMFEENPITSAVYGAGNIIGGLTDIGMTAIGKTLSTADDFITGGYVKEQGKELFTKLANTEKGKEGLQALSSGMESYTKWAKENPTTSRSLEGVVNIGSILPLSKVAQATGKAIIPLAKPIIKGTGKVINKTGEGLAATTEYGTRLLTGLNRETQQVIKNNPKLFQAIKKGEISAENITGDLQTRIKGRLTNLNETGKGYQELKKSNITFPKKEIQGIYDNRLTQEGLSKSLIELPIEDRNAIKQAQYYLNELPNKNLTTKEAIELKAKLRSLVSYDKGVSPEGERVVKGLLKDLDNNLKTKIPGFKELDEIYGPEREFLNKIQKDLFNKDGTLKDTAISTIRNLTGKGKENKLDRLEKIMPGIGEKVKGIKAYEDLQNAIEGKTGSYARGALLGGGGYIAGGPIGGIITFAITHPSIASKALELYGLSKSKINNLFNKFKSKTPLDNIEKTQIKEAIKTPSNKLFNNIIKNDGISIINNMDNIGSNIQQNAKKIKPTNKAGQKIDLGDGTYATKDPLTGKVVIRPKSELQKKGGYIGNLKLTKATPEQAKAIKDGGKAMSVSDDLKIPENINKFDKKETQVVYHGSKYDFETFETGRIGTGEGNTGFGEGIYFADKGGAKGYADKLETYKGEGKVYKVEIPNDKYLLDLDKYISNQSPYIQNKISNILDKYKNDLKGYSLDSNGSSIYKGLENKYGSQKATNILNENGIKGNVFNFSEGERYQVIFDDKYMKNLGKERNIPIKEAIDKKKDKFINDYIDENIDVKLYSFFKNKYKSNYKNLNLNDTYMQKLINEAIKSYEQATKPKLLKPKQVSKVSNVKKVVSPSDDLIKEARKYKSADEFINKQNIVFHGRTKKGGDITSAKGGELGQGTYFTKNKKYAEEYAKDNYGEDIKGEVIGLSTNNLNIKTIPKEEWLQEKRKLPFGSDLKTIRDKYIKKGYDGIFIENENQGIIFPEVINKIKTEAQLKQIYEQANKKLPKK